MKKLLLVLCLFLTSCVSLQTKRDVIRKSTIKWEGEKTNIRDLLDINGMYNNNNKYDNGYMFFEDGSWVTFGLNKSPDNGRIGNFLDYVRTWEQNKQLRWSVYWGVYSLQNDTIIVHAYRTSGFLGRWSLSERRFKIIDRQTIQLIYLRSIEPDYDFNYGPYYKEKPLHFIPVDSLPPSDCWLKERKWMWRHESDWKNYMQHVEEINKESVKRLPRYSLINHSTCNGVFFYCHIIILKSWPVTI